MTQFDAQASCDRIAALCEATGPTALMEVCGTHTVALFRTGVRSMLPDGLRLISGPGCPVCVTSQGYMDAACALADRPEITVATYGDMIRVPGRTGSLAERRATGARVQVIYSPRDAVKLAAESPDRQVVFLAVGFETTAPTTAAALVEAQARGLENFTVLAAHKRVLPAMLALVADPEVPIDGFICPGHVSIVLGANAYEPLARDHGKPCVVAGFEPSQMLKSIERLLEMRRDGLSEVDNVYGVAVTPGGNRAAQGLIDRVFEPAPAVWRAMGEMPDSGLELREEFQRYDATRVFGVQIDEDYELPGCRCGEVIQGKIEPKACGLFGKKCTPTHPVGPCMVSSEGTCAAWYKYGR